jgi:hypothetical protein
MKIPLNIITTGKYTIGKEFINTIDKKEYQGYYYELNGKTFAGKEFNENAPELKKITDVSFYFDKINKTYASLTKINPTNIIDPKKIVNRVFDYDAQEQYYYTYYAKKLNSNPILIREIDKETYLSLQNNANWQVIALVTNDGDGFILEDEIVRAETIMPGIADWLTSTPGMGGI